jgi:hypothetical protein
VTGPELDLRRRIMAAFALTGAPPPAAALDRGVLERLAEQYTVVLRDDGEILMAHPFAAHREGASVEAGGRTWWGNCAWDGFGIAAALGLRDARITAGDVAAAPGAVFHVAVPAARWWNDIVHT